MDIFQRLIIARAGYKLTHGTQAFTVGSIYNLKSSREDLGLFQLEGPGQNPAAACVDIQWKVIVRSEAAEQPQMNVQHPSRLD